MFEDIKKDDNRITGEQGPAQDPYDAVDPIKQTAPISGPSAVQSGRIKPVEPRPSLSDQMQQKTSDEMQQANQRNVGPSQPLQNLQQVPDWESERKGSALRRIFSIIVVITVVAAVGLGGWFVYTSYVLPSLNAPADDEQNQITNTPPAVSQNTNTTNTNTFIPPTQPINIDQDDDGLTDVEETTLGTDIRSSDSDRDGLMDGEEVRNYFTDPLNPDTDNDGLLDREEAFVWQTDPTVPDTDGDGYLDGEEVANGYNPNGPGRLVTPDQIQ